MSAPRFLVVGHSHTGSINAALRASEPDARHGHVLLSRSKPKSAADRFARSARKAIAAAFSRPYERKGRLDVMPIIGQAEREIRNAMRVGVGAMLDPPRRIRVRQIPAILSEADIVVLASVGGNAHNVFGLVESEVPFDFVLPEREDLGVDPARQLVPFDAMRERLEHVVRRPLRELALLRELVGERMLVLESPPPIADDAFILERAAPYFRNKHGDVWPVVPPALRYKIWRVNSEIYAEFCREWGLTFVPAPAVTMDEGMFLKRRGWGDSVHGNVWYGARVVDSVRALLAASAGDAAARFREPAAAGLEG